MSARPLVRKSAASKPDPCDSTLSDLVRLLARTAVRDGLPEHDLAEARPIGLPSTSPSKSNGDKS